MGGIVWAASNRESESPSLSSQWTGLGYSRLTSTSHTAPHCRQRQTIMGVRNAVWTASDAHTTHAEQLP